MWTWEIWGCLVHFPVWRLGWVICLETHTSNQVFAFTSVTTHLDPPKKALFLSPTFHFSSCKSVTPGVFKQSCCLKPISYHQPCWNLLEFRNIFRSHGTRLGFLCRRCSPCPSLLVEVGAGPLLRNRQQRLSCNFYAAPFPLRSVLWLLSFFPSNGSWISSQTINGNLQHDREIVGEIVEKNRERRVTRSKPFTKKMVGRRRVVLSEHTGTGIDGKVHRSRTGPDRNQLDQNLEIF